MNFSGYFYLFIKLLPNLYPPDIRNPQLGVLQPENGKFRNSNNLLHCRHQQEPLQDAAVIGWWYQSLSVCKHLGPLWLISSIASFWWNIFWKIIPLTCWCWCWCITSEISGYRKRAKQHQSPGLTNRPGAVSDLCHWRIHKLDPATTVSNFQVLTTAIKEVFNIWFNLSMRKKIKFNCSG